MKSHIKMYLLVCIAALLLTGCDTVFDVHPYDVRVKGETNLNAKNIQKIEQTVKSKDTIRFAVISDSHQWLDDLVDAVNDINSRKDSIDFVIHCGDISDFGATREMKWTRERMLKLKMPSVVLLGNHDCLGTGNQTYEAIYGNPDFSFIAGGVVPGVLVLKPDFPENKNDWPFLWGQNEYVIDLGARYLFLVHAAQALLQER